MTTAPFAVADRPHIPFSAMLRMVLLYACILGGVIITYRYWTPENGPVVIPLAVLTAVLCTFLLVLAARQRGGAPMFEIGGFFGMMVYNYGAYPVIVFLARGMVYGELNDGRLHAAGPTPAEIGGFLWWYVFFLATFAVVYVVVTMGFTPHFRVVPPPRGIVVVVVTAYCAGTVALWLSSKLWPYDVQTYGDQYLALRQPPMVARQLVSLIVQFMPTLLIILTAAWFTEFRRRKFWIALLLAWITFTTVRAMGARTMLFLMLFVAACLFHQLVRRISLTVAIGGVIGGLLLLAWMGWARHAEDGVVHAEGALGGSSEFEVILANAYDLKYVQGAEGILTGKPAVYFGDFTALIPQQFFPWPKQTKANWYLANYWPQVSAEGGGFAFGMISEAVTGFGVAEVFVRAIIVGLAFGLLHRRVASRPITFWWLVSYLWLTVESYHIVRNTTFSLLQWSIYQLLVPIVAIRVTYLLLSRGRQRLRQWRSA